MTVTTKNWMIWGVFLTALIVPIIAAAFSPLLAWRDPVYIGAGFAGIAAMTLLIIQPALAGQYLPGLTIAQSRRMHRIAGIGLVILVVVHVAGLWVTSPPDVIDALFFASPTPFSVWGVIAMWVIFLSALIAGLRRRLRMNPRRWRLIHTCFAVVIVTSTILHALLIVGTMETTSKRVLCVLIVLLTAKVIVGRRKPRLT